MYSKAWTKILWGTLGAVLTFGMIGYLDYTMAQDVGLVFPNEASSASDVRVLDDGRVAWCVSYLPDATEVVKFAEEVQRQITGIMADYGRTKAIMGAVKRGSK